jgi:hypothetical protein
MFYFLVAASLTFVPLTVPDFLVDSSILFAGASRSRVVDFLRAQNETKVRLKEF